jgi:hypothetical protein
MGAASKRRKAQVGPRKAPSQLQSVWAPEQRGGIVALMLFVAVAMDCWGADQSFEAASTSMTESIRAQFPYGTNSSLSAGKGGQVDGKNLPTTAPQTSPGIQSTGATLLRLKIESEDPLVRLPGFNVNAQRYSGLEYRLDQIDKSISREQSLSVPTNLDMKLNNDGILPSWISIGTDRETAEKRANDAYQRMQVLEMQRIIEVKLPFATPEERKRLKDERALLLDFSGPKYDFGHLRD